MGKKRLLLSALIGLLLCMALAACSPSIRATYEHSIPIPSLWSDSHTGYCFDFLGNGMVNVDEGLSPIMGPTMYCCDIEEEVIVIYLDAHTQADRARSVERLEVPYRVEGQILTIIVNNTEISMALGDGPGDTLETPPPRDLGA